MCSPNMVGGSIHLGSGVLNFIFETRDSFNIYWASTSIYYVPVTIRDSEDIATNKIDSLWFHVIKIKYNGYTDIQVYKIVMTYACITPYKHIIPSCGSILITNSPFLGIKSR